MCQNPVNLGRPCARGLAVRCVDKRRRCLQRRWICACTPASRPHVILRGKAARLQANRELSAECTALLLLRLGIYTLLGKRRLTTNGGRMKFTCTTKDIAAAVGAASKVVNAHTTVPILSNVLLQADDGKIAVRATDLELTLEHAFPAEVAESRRGHGPGQALCELSGQPAPGTLELTGTPTRASVKCERSNYDFHALPADEYPPLPAAARGALFHDRRQAFPRRHRRHDLRRLERRGARRRADGHAARSRGQRADDGRDRRLPPGEVRRRRSTRAQAENEKFIVPSRALAEVARNLGGGEQIAINALGAQSNQLQMTAGDVSITVRLVDGQYPNYQQVIPAKFDRTITVSTAAADRQLAPGGARRRRPRQHGEARDRQSNA